MFEFVMFIFVSRKKTGRGFNETNNKNSNCYRFLCLKVDTIGSRVTLRLSNLTFVFTTLFCVMPLSILYATYTFLCVCGGVLVTAAFQPRNSILNGCLILQSFCTKLNKLLTNSLILIEMSDHFKLKWLAGLSQIKRFKLSRKQLGVSP